MESSEISAQAANTSDPRAGLRAVSSLRMLADTLELRQVEAALRAGMTWQEIADALGVTRQAAHKKHAKRIDPRIPTPRRNHEQVQSHRHKHANDLSEGNGRSLTTRLT